MPQTFLNDDQWRRITPLLPKRRSAGRPWADDRRVLEGILRVLKTSARWRDLPHATLRRAAVGDGCTCGKRMSSGCQPGVRFRASLMLKAA